MRQERPEPRRRGTMSRWPLLPSGALRSRLARESKPSAAIGVFLVSVATYSFFPLIGASVVTHAEPVLFIGLAHAFAFLTLTWVSVIVLRRGEIADPWRLREHVFAPRYLTQAALSGFANAAGHACIFASFLYINSAASTILYEIWPIGAIVAIRHLLPDRYRRITLREWVLAGLALSGAGLLVQAELVHGLSAGGHHTQLIVHGLVLALASAVLMAVSSSLDVRLCHRLGDAVDPLLRPVISQNVVKAFSSTGAILVGVLVFHARAPTAHVVGLAAVVGVAIIALGVVTYHAGNILAQSASVNSLWYLTPVLSLVWLYAFHGVMISPEIALAAMVIVGANIVLISEGDTETGYNALIGGMCVSAFVCVYFRGVANPQYYTMLSVASGFVGVSASMILQRTHQRDESVALLAIDVLEGVSHSSTLTATSKESLTSAIVASLDEGEAFMGAGSTKPSLWSAHPDVGPSLTTAGRKLEVMSSRVVSFGEMLVLAMLATLDLVIAHTNRPNTMVGDLAPVVLTAVLSFLCLRVFTSDARRSTGRVVDMYRHGDSPAPTEAGPGGANIAPGESLDTRVRLISVSLLTAVLAIYVLGLVSKYGV